MIIAIFIRYGGKTGLTGGGHFVKTDNGNENLCFLVGGGKAEKVCLNFGEKTGLATWPVESMNPLCAHWVNEHFTRGWTFASSRI
jgi:hypothetical protein